MTTAKLIEEIAFRAAGLVPGLDPMEVGMDLCACIEGGCPLRLEELLQADKMDFLHDIAGIRKNLNRNTYKLENCFYPRFAGK